MTETVLRNNVATWLNDYKGIKEGSAKHIELLNIFNNSGKCTRYKMTVNDAWCATGASCPFIALNLLEIFPCVECSCQNMITLAQSAGIWVEDDSYTPKVGDLILYDWDDSGNGDNTGWADHVGIVQSISGTSFTVIECNKSNTVGTRNMTVNGKYIRGYITPNYASIATSDTASSSSSKSLADVAKEVWAGKWGNGDERKTALEKAGYNYSDVQTLVNAMSTSTNSTTVYDVALEVIAGKWGNGSDRKTALTNAGYNYSEVQNVVNILLK